MKLSDVEQKTGVTALIIGDFGRGKTWFAGGAPQPLYFFDFDGGISTLLKRFKGKTPDIEFDTYRDTPAIPKRSSTSTKLSADASLIGSVNSRPKAYLKFEEKLTTILDGQYAPETIVYDSLSSLERIFMNYIMAVNSGQGRVMGAPNQGDYGVFVRKFEELLSYMLLPATMGINVICTAHIQTKKDEITGRILHEPALIGKSMPSAIGKEFDEVWIATTSKKKDGVEYMVQVQPSREFNCKTRWLDPGGQMNLSQLEVEQQLWAGRKKS